MTQDEWDDFKANALALMERARVGRMTYARIEVDYAPVSGAGDELLGEGRHQISADHERERVAAFQPANP